MKTRVLAAAIVVLGTMGSGALQAQTANPLSAGAKRTYDIIKGYVTKAAAKMPEEHYSFKPTPDVRSFGQLVAHIADANYGFCSAVLGEKPPEGGFDPKTSFEKTKTTKADLEKALAASFAYCDKVHAGMTDAAGAAMVKSFLGRDGQAVAARVQHASRLRALRQHRHLHAHEEPRAAFVRALQPVGSYPYNREAPAPASSQRRRPKLPRDPESPRRKPPHSSGSAALVRQRRSPQRRPQNVTAAAAARPCT